MFTFDQIFVVGLTRQPERRARFEADCAPLFDAGALASVNAPEFVPAIDGRATGCPFGWVYRHSTPEFYRGLGAWGCYRTHLGIIERLLNSRQFGPTLILEDDAYPVADFAAAYAEFLAALPADWDSIYLGGEHLCKPLAVDPNPKIARCMNANRSHAYAVRGEEFLRRLYQKLSDWRAWPDTWYADHAMGSLQVEGRWNVYAPATWLIGQRAGFSECELQPAAERTWNASP